MLVALGVNRGDNDVDGLVHPLAAGIPATITAAVILDLLARPRPVALGERAGLVVTPRPLHAAQRRVSLLRPRITFHKNDRNTSTPAGLCR